MSVERHMHQLGLRRTWRGRDVPLVHTFVTCTVASQPRCRQIRSIIAIGADCRSQTTFRGACRPCVTKRGSSMNAIMKFAGSAALFGLATAISPADAADLAVKAPPPVAAAVYNWTG